MTDGAGRRIAFLIQDLRNGGAERVTIWLANGMAERGLDVDLVLINRRGEDAYFASLDPRVRLWPLRQGRTLTSLFGFRDYFDQAKPDVVISALTHVNVAATLGRKLARHKPRLILVEHNQMSKNIKRKSGFVRLAYAVAPKVYRLADRVGAVSEGVKADFVAVTGFPSDGVDVFYNPVVTASLHKQRLETPDHPWFEDGQPPVILGVGRLTEQKNFPLLIRAFAELRRTRTARLMILGEGKLRDELRRLADDTGHGDNIALPGFVDNPFAYMSQAAVFALSSDWEGLPTVLIEAMACGASVVSTDCPSGPDEILEGGSLAPLTPPGDVSAFAQALATALDRQRPIQPLIARAEAFSTDAALDHYLEAAFPEAPRQRRLTAA
ncbi:MAG: glycosyltransferase [Pseudomonadota bacterium]